MNPGRGATNVPLNVTSGATGSPPERVWKVRREARAVAEARRFAELAISSCSADCRRATSMVVAELTENLLKYGGNDDDSEAGTIAISVRAGLVRIRVSNVPKRAEDARLVREMIARISTAPNVMQLYRSRLGELLKNPALPRAQLGLLRIVFEGGFKLSCRFDPPFLEITAERSCGGEK